DVCSSDLEGNKIPQKCKIEFKDQVGSEVDGVYLISAEYTDLGEGSAPVKGNTRIVLRSTKVQAEDADEKHHMIVFSPMAIAMNTDAHFVLKDIDLKDISKINIRYSSPTKSGKLEVRYDALDGPLAGEFAYTATNDRSKIQLATVPIEDPGKKVDVYFVVKGENPPYNGLLAVDWVEFLP